VLPLVVYVTCFLVIYIIFNRMHDRLVKCCHWCIRDCFVINDISQPVSSSALYIVCLRTNFRNAVSW